MVKQLLLSLLLAASCLGQAFTMSDQPFLAALQGGAPTVQGCGSYTNGLLRYWKIDEGTGQWVKDYVTGNAYAASVVGTYYQWVTNTPPVPIYIRNTNSIQVYNYDTYLNCGSGANNTEFYIISGDYAVSAWSYRIGNIAPQNHEVIVEGRERGSDQLHFALDLTGDTFGTSRYTFGDATLINVGATYCFGPSVSSVGSGWNLWVGTRNGTVWTIYQNGASVGSATTSGQATPPTPCTITIGNNYRQQIGQPKNFNGYIADVRIYNRGLSSNDVWCLYHQYYGQ